MLGLKTNLEKSELITSGEVANVEDLASKLGYRVYLGFFVVEVGGSYILFVYLGLLFWQPFLIYLSFYL